MVRLLIIIFFFFLSLLNFFPVPSKQAWYAGILIPEYPWIFILLMILLLVWSYKKKKLRTMNLVIGTITLIIVCSPIVRAYNIANDLEKRLETSFGVKNSDMQGFHQEKPYSFLQMLTGNGAKKIAFTTHHYANTSGEDLTLNYYPSAVDGLRPCLFVVHGGSWTRGDNSEIAAVNNYFANAGYHVVTINYRLAPKYPSPAQQEDVKSAFVWVKSHATELKIDTNNFVMLGRSAGASIVLTAAYTMHEPGVKGVVGFYGANDMLWSYEHPCNPKLMDSRLVQRNFLGGTPQQVKEKYILESPYLQANSQSVPTLLVHGKNDAHVYYEQSVRLAKRLDELKVKNMLLSLPWATHGCEYNLNGPSGQLSMYTVERFCYAVTQSLK